MQTNVNRIPPSRSSAGWARALAIVFLCTTLALTAALISTWVYILRMKTEAPPQADTLLARPELTNGPVSPLLVHYRLDIPGRGEIFPSLAGEAPERFPVAILTITNTSERAVVQTVTAQVQGWSRMAEQRVAVGAHETRRVELNPELLSKAYSNGEIRRASLEVRANDADGSSVFAQTRPVFVHGAWDLYWGERFSNAQYVARWVTPHDEAVLRLVSDARRYMPRGRMVGYEPNLSEAMQAAQVRRGANAVFGAMRRSGLSYVNSYFTFGSLTDEAQRIRAPEETLTLRSANCIDVSVAFASAMENLGLEPVIVIVPGHAFTGVRLARGSSQVLYLDLTVLPNGTFTEANRRALAWLRKIPPQQVLTVDVAAARALGIYPMPEPQVAAVSAE